MTAPMESSPVAPMAKRGLDPLDAVPIALAVVAALLLLGGVLFAFDSADANGAGSTDRFRLLGQAANPFIAFLALSASALVADTRRRRGGRTFVAGGVAVGIATAVSLAVALLALNGVLTDLTGDATGLFRVSAIVSRLATLGLSGLTIWIAAAAPRDRTRP